MIFEDEGRGVIGVVKVVSLLMVIVVVLLVMFFVIGVYVLLEGLVGGVLEGVFVLLWVVGIDGVGVEMVVFVYDIEFGVDEVDFVVLVGVFMDVVFILEIVGFDDLVL